MITTIETLRQCALVTKETSVSSNRLRLRGGAAVFVSNPAYPGVSGTRDLSGGPTAVGGTPLR